MRTPSVTLPHESLFFDNQILFRAQNERYFAAGHRTRSRSPRASALAVRADEGLARLKQQGDTPDCRWHLREFNDLRLEPVVFAKTARFFARCHFHTRNSGRFARAMKHGR
jgi:hypothetical protein